MPPSTRSIRRVGVWGASAGGHLVALLGTTGHVPDLEGSGGNLDQSSRVQCVVDWFGPTDLLTMAGHHNNPASPESRLIGGPVQENKEKARQASPVAYVGADSAPFLIMHGDQDTTVPPGQSEELAAALRKAAWRSRSGSSPAMVMAGPGSACPKIASWSRTFSPSTSASRLVGWANEVPLAKLGSGG